MHNRLIEIVSRLVARITALLHTSERYYPERHYMRGRGPKTAARERNAQAGLNGD